MIYINLFFLKTINGMFFYCLDYTLGQKVIFVCRRDSLISVEVQRLGLRYLEVSTVLDLYRLFWSKKPKKIFSPTIHTLPFLRGQTVTLHDLYPFVGLKGQFKYLLLITALLVTKITIAHINKSSLASVKMKLMRGKRIYAPNIIPEIESRKLNYTKTGIIGLFGTDSKKKSYDDFLKRLGHKFNYKIRLFGNENAYTNRLLRDYKKLDLEVISSKYYNLGDFLDTCQVVVSVAKEEGFCRPVAFALMKKIPVLLIEDPVFKEFYEGCAVFVPSAKEIPGAVSKIMNNQSPGKIKIYSRNFKKRAEEINRQSEIAKKLIFGIE